MRRIAVTAAIILGCFCKLSAQRLMGLVIQRTAQDKEEPLAGANVYWLGTTTGTATGANGIFLIDRVPATDRLVISFAGFSSDTLTIGNQTNIKVELKAFRQLQEVIVEGWKPSSGIDHSRAINTVAVSEKELFKAACCNLSESFETNPSVDVAFSDAITGTRQIQMLGLSGPNTLISVENMPGVRGLASSQGIQFIPGPWINSIEVTKGVGPVVNGYESIAGQINVELKKPQQSDKLYVNGYVNQSARSETNLGYTAQAGKKWATTFLLHGSARPLKMDQNNDGFLDLPLGSQLNFINRWVFNSGTGWLGQFGIKLLRDDKQGGQTNFDPEADRFSSNRYGFEINTRREEAWGKLGYQFPGKPYKSFGLQLSATRHDHESYFGSTTHNALEHSGYANFIYQSIIGSTDHAFKTGLSFLYDAYNEHLGTQAGIRIISNESDRVINAVNFNRTEKVPGAFFEYTYNHLDKITLIAGARVDYHNLFGVFFTPRLHARIDLSETTTLRLSAGKGTRVANILTENSGILASSRQLVFSGFQSSKAYGYKPDKAWNFGMNFSQDFTLNYRPGAVTVDYFFTDFRNQVVLDYDKSAREANFFGLGGKSYSHSLQVQTDYQLMRRFDIRLAYRWLDVRTDYLNGLLRRPLVPASRAFMNLAYETKNTWKFDYTFQLTGKQRIPDTSINPEAYRLSAYSPAYVLMNAQVTKDFGERWSLYAGMENITGFRLSHPIVASGAPFSPYFDSSLVWGPVFGRMAYAGFRYRVK